MILEKIRQKNGLVGSEKIVVDGDVFFESYAKIQPVINKVLVHVVGLFTA